MVQYKLYVAKEEIKVMAKIELLRQQENKTFDRGRMVYFGLAAAAIIAALVLHSSKYAVTICAALAAGCLYTAVYGWKRQFLRTREQHIRRTIMRTPDLPRMYIFSADEIEIVTESGSGRFSWDRITGYGQIKHYLYLLREDNSLLLVDENRLPEEEFRQLKEWIQAHRLPNCTMKK